MKATATKAVTGVTLHLNVGEAALLRRLLDCTVLLPPAGDRLRLDAPVPDGYVVGGVPFHETLYSCLTDALYRAEKEVL